ncbi:hypothetical protein pb186bvf_010861 [Paramecium bursaria]
MNKNKGSKQKIPDFNKWHQNEAHKLKQIKIIKDFDPDYIRYTDLFIFKSHFQQVECVQRLKKVIDEGLHELFKLEIFRVLQLQRNKNGQDMKLNRKLDYYQSMYEVEIEQIFDLHKYTQFYKTYMNSKQIIRVIYDQFE